MGSVIAGIGRVNVGLGTEETAVNLWKTMPIPTRRWKMPYKEIRRGKWRGGAHFRLHRCSGVGDRDSLHAETVRMLSGRDGDSDVRCTS
eukprot:11043544-Ditylum_brightwellii.AAC.1